MFGVLVVCYLYLGGMGAALGVLASIYALTKETLTNPRRNAQVISLLYVSSFGCLLIGCVCLWGDLDNPQQLASLFFAPTPSYITFGTYALLLNSFLALFLFVRWSLTSFEREPRSICILAVVCIVSGICVMAYTGLFLSSMKGVPFWNTMLIPLLFVASSLSCALAYMSAVFMLNQQLRRSQCRGFLWERVQRCISVIEGLLIVLLVGYACFQARYVLFSYAGLGEDHVSFSPRELAFCQSLMMLVQGKLSLWFWFGVVGCLFILPIALRLLSSKGLMANTHARMSSIISMLFGGFALRFCVVSAGVHPMVTAIGG